MSHRVDFWARAQRSTCPYISIARSARQPATHLRGLSGARRSAGASRRDRTHALRLMMSDCSIATEPQVIVGHLAEGLPFLLPRVEHRLRHARAQNVAARPSR